MPKRKRLRGEELQRLRFRVFERDGWRCVALSLDPEHRCAGIYGYTDPGRWDYRDVLTLEHVLKRSGTGMRADDREEECVTLCLHANSPSGWASTHKHQERMYLAERYPEHWADVPEVQP